MYLQAKLQSADLVRAIFVGLVEGSTPGVDNATFLAAAHFGFSIIDTTISFSFGGASATTTDTTADLAAATDVVLTAHYDGDGTWRGYVDGVLKVTSTVTTTNPDELMALCTSVENSATTSASDVQLDYIYFKAEM